MNPPQPSTHDTGARPSSALERWQRIGLGIRLAYNPGKPEVLRCWLALGSQLAAQGLIDEATMLQRTLRLLMQTAQDEALPWFWRSVCLEHATRPLARIGTLLALHDPLQARAIEAFVQAARDRLDAVPPLKRQAQA